MHRPFSDDKEEKIAGWSVRANIGCLSVLCTLLCPYPCVHRNIVTDGAFAGGAKLVPQETDKDDDPFSFLVQDYRPDYFFYEIVMYYRKLLLNGLVVVRLTLFSRRFGR
eukprot:SAG31_NODE_218_length_19934_cov_81.634837_12_plen_109_part_00